MTGSEPTASVVAESTANNETPSAQLEKSASIIGAATLASRLLGLVRDQLLAYLFGARDVMDAFNVAIRIPNLMRDLFAEGVMSAAFVPTFMNRLTTQSRQAAWHLGTQLLNALILSTGTIVAVGIFFAEPLTGLIASGYASVPKKFELTVQLTRLTLPFLTFVAVAAAIMGMLNSLNRFFVPALSPAMYNIGIIVGCVLLVPLMPGLGLDPIFAVAIGALLGAMGQVLLQLPSLYREGYRHHLNLNPSDPGLRKILSLMGPGTFAGAGVQINLLVNMILATGQGSGAVSWLGYAFRIMYLPIGLFGISIASATLPVVSRHAARKEFDDIRDVVSRALRLMLVANVPAMFGLIALAEPIVSLIFERGNFTAEDSSATAAALLFYAPGLIGYSAVRIAVPCFYALGNSLVPAYISMASVILNVGLNLFLVELMGYRGLALGTSVTALVNAVTLLAFLQYRLNGLDLRRVLLAFTKISAASTIMAISTWSTNEFLSNYWPGLALAVEILRLSISIVLGITVLIAVSRLLRIEELAQMWQQLRTRIRRSD